MASKRRSFALLAGLPLAVALIISGCSAEAGAADETPVVEEYEATEEVVDEPEEEIIAVEEDPYPARWPLTGVGTEEIADRPALLIKVNNTPATRPQGGLEAADIIYEVVLEGGTTRFIAVYHSELPDSVVPVRSARPTDIPLVTPYGGMFAFSGAQPVFITALREVSGGINQLFIHGSVPGMTRVSGRGSLDNVAVDLQVMLNHANDTRMSPPPGMLPFSRDLESSSVVLDGSPVATLDVRMSGGQRTVFNWDAASETFLRFDGTTPSMSTSGDQLAATNIVLIASDMVNSNVANQTTAVPTNLLTGHSGRAVFAVGGQYIEGTWEKNHDEDPFLFLDNAGQIVEFAPGRTFIQIVPTHSGGWTIS